MTKMTKNLPLACTFTHNYRMAPNFRGAQFLRIGLPQVFVEIIFKDQSPVTFIDLFIIFRQYRSLLVVIMRCHFNP